MKSGLTIEYLWKVETFFDLNVDSRTRGVGHFQDCRKRSKLNIRKFLFSERVVQRWNNLSQEDIDHKTLNGFKKHLRKLRHAACPCWRQARRTYTGGLLYGLAVRR